MLPEAMLVEHLEAEEEAEAQAVGGRVAAGFLLLARGLRRARSAHAAGEPWGEELARRYQATMDEYAVRHEMKSSGPGPSLWRP